jgi:hypothetical protein
MVVVFVRVISFLEETGHRPGTSGNTSRCIFEGPRCCRHQCYLPLPFTNAALSSALSFSAKRRAIKLKASKVIGNPDIVRHISEFLRRTDIITVDPSVEVRDEHSWTS